MKISSTCTFGRNHWRTKRTLGCALFSESRALNGFFNSLQYFSCNAQRRLFSYNIFNIKYLLSIIIRIFIFQLKTTCRNVANTSPLSVCSFKNFCEQVLCCNISFFCNYPAVLILNFGFSDSSCFTVRRIPCKISIGSKPVTTIGTLYFSAIEKYSL